MPGIITIFNRNGVDEHLLDRMCSSIRHEDWYQVDKYIAGQFAFARVHLGITNPEPQPVFNEDKTLCIFMDGEVFFDIKEKKDLELKEHEFKVNNDPEFCLHLYEEYGESFVEKLNGSFALAILNLKDQNLLVVNDRYGLRPHYFTRQGDKFLFAPEVKAILQDRGIEKEIDEVAVAEFFTFGYILGNKTYFKDIQLLPPASILKLDENGLSSKEYWNFNVPKIRKQSMEAYVNESIHLFKQSVKRRMRLPHPITVTLSGGLDSRSIVGAVDEKDRDKVKTFTYIFKGQDKTSKIAKKIAKTCNVQNVQGNLTPEVFLKNVGMGIALTDGMRSMSSFHLVSLVDKKELWSDIVIFAMGLGELFGGEGLIKKKYFEINENEYFIKIFYDGCSLPISRLNGLIDMKLRGQVFNSLKGEMEWYIQKSDSLASAALYFELQNRVRRFIFPALPTLRWQMEVRNPPYDYDFMDFILSIPRELLCDRKIQTEFLKKLNSDLAKIQDNNVKMRADAPQSLKNVSKRMFSYGYGLRKILERRAKGRISLPFFRRDTPEYDEWFFGPNRFNDFVIDVLSDVKSLRELPHFNEEYVKKLLEEQLRYEKNNVEILLRIATFELWYRSFVEDRITHDKNAQRWVKREGSGQENSPGKEVPI